MKNILKKIFLCLLLITSFLSAGGKFDEFSYEQLESMKQTLQHVKALHEKVFKGCYVGLEHFTNKDGEFDDTEFKADLSFVTEQMHCDAELKKICKIWNIMLLPLYKYLEGKQKILTDYSVREDWFRLQPNLEKTQRDYELFFRKRKQENPDADETLSDACEVIYKGFLGVDSPIDTYKEHCKRAEKEFSENEAKMQMEESLAGMLLKASSDKHGAVAAVSARARLQRKLVEKNRTVVTEMTADGTFSLFKRAFLLLREWSLKQIEEEDNSYLEFYKIFSIKKLSREESFSPIEKLMRLRSEIILEQVVRRKQAEKVKDIKFVPTDPKVLEKEKREELDSAFRLAKISGIFSAQQEANVEQSKFLKIFDPKMIEREHNPISFTDRFCDCEYSITLFDLRKYFPQEKRFLPIPILSRTSSSTVMNSSQIEEYRADRSATLAQIDMYGCRVPCIRIDDQMVERADLLHAFSDQVDINIENYGVCEKSWEQVLNEISRDVLRISILGIITLPSHEQVLGIFEYLIDPTINVCFHRCFKPIRSLNFESPESIILLNAIKDCLTDLRNAQKKIDGGASSSSGISLYDIYSEAIRTLNPVIAAKSQN